MNYLNNSRNQMHLMLFYQMMILVPQGNLTKGETKFISKWIMGLKRNLQKPKRKEIYRRNKAGTSRVKEYLKKVSNHTR